MKKLIINADDYGLCESVNAGILECFINGLVSDFSFMVNLEGFDRSNIMLSDTVIKNIGLHLNITVGRSILNSKTKLTDKGGRFFNLKTLFFKIMSGTIPEEDIYEEIIAQINLLLSEGYQITHIDSHTNIHLLPQIMKPLIHANKSSGLNVPIRMPYEKKIRVPSLTRRNMIRITALNLLTLNNQIFTKYRSPITTIGGNFFNNSNNKLVFKEILDRIDNSSFDKFELAVHPGYISDKLLEYDSYYSQRVEELNFLLNNNHIFEKSGLMISSFEEVTGRN